MISNKDEIRKFLLLQEKSQDDLATIARSLELSSEFDTKANMALAIIAATSQPKKLNHIIALASHKDAASSLLLKNIRDQITASNLTRIFEVPKMDGDTYKEKLRYLPTTEDNIAVIQKNELAYRKDDTIRNLVKNAAQYSSYFVIKPSGKNSWLMLFLESK